VLLRLEAEGIIKSGLLTTRPISQKEAVRLVAEAEKHPRSESPFIKQLVDFLKKRFKPHLKDTDHIKPVDIIYGEYVFSDSDLAGKLTYNNDGFNYEKHSNLRLGISSTAVLGLFSFEVNPELRYSDSDTDLVIKRAYGIFGSSELALELGQESQWWGPGVHGALLISNNPQPLTTVKLTNPRPIMLPSVFKNLGLLKFTFFVSRLEDDREISNPFIWGLRINLKPNPYLELGLNRTALLGGEGRSEDLRTWFESFTGKGENETGSGAGDQKAGLDLKLTFPFQWQPIQLYAEAAGEDEAGGLPTKWAYITGLYLPRVLSVDRLSLRFEYADNHISGNPDVWYNHGVYKTGYRYKGEIIGHHMGTDSRDMFFEAEYFLPGENNGRIGVSYDREKHNLSGEVKETVDELAVKMQLTFKEAITLKTTYRYGKIENLDNNREKDENINVFMTELRYRF
jgi:hypothetical protein